MERRDGEQVASFPGLSEVKFLKSSHNRETRGRGLACLSHLWISGEFVVFVYRLNSL